ncbi:hypothetical protein [Schleiferia thermophila]|uniref:hypothetical protein n=1 Tax=Schleiferia thermophila TaxID=884107 RepID=UPI000FFA7C5E|nr:hypothetical protein [Schleiferia thermophila]GCD80894.1 hypothetical protein JCM30197_21410 [Schleiferia thermophila]GCD80920.1 hypothetical protein JCM30197_21670 [Schleiferia thermophila]
MNTLSHSGIGGSYTTYYAYDQLNRLKHTTETYQTHQQSYTYHLSMRYNKVG